MPLVGSVSRCLRRRPFRRCSRRLRSGRLPLQSLRRGGLLPRARRVSRRLPRARRVSRRLLLPRRRRLLPRPRFGFRLPRLSPVLLTRVAKLMLSRASRSRHNRSHDCRGFRDGVAGSVLRGRALRGRASQACAGANTRQSRSLRRNLLRLSPRLSPGGTWDRSWRATQWRASRGVPPRSQGQQPRTQRRHRPLHGRRRAPERRAAQWR